MKLGSVLHLTNQWIDHFDLVLTDPPYMEDVQYAELSDFFYVWLSRVLQGSYAELPSSAPTEEDISVSWGRFGKKKLSVEFYDKAMTEAFRQIHLSLKQDGLLVLFFAHSSSEAWNLLLRVLRDSRFRVVSSYAVHTESITNVLARGKTSFMSSIVVACRKILNDKKAFFEDMVPRIEDRTKDIINRLSIEDLLSLPITDLLIMAYGKVLEETTQCTILKSYKGDFEPDFESLINNARDFILKEVVSEITGRSPNILGSEMSYYIITKIFYSGLLNGDEALKIARAYDLNIQNLERHNVVKIDKGNITLVDFSDQHFKLKPDQINVDNLHQQLLFLENLAGSDGVSAVKRAVSESSNFRINDLKQIISILIKSIRLSLNKQEKLTEAQKNELTILESLADVFGSSSNARLNNLDGFMK